MAKKTTKRSITKAELIDALTAATSDGVTKRQVREVLEALQAIGYAQLKKRGVFTLPGLVKLEVKARKKTKAGVRKVFGEERFLPSKPATKRVAARAVAACQEAAG